MSEPDITAKNPPDDLKHEYSEVCNDLRNHANLRFNSFTVYLAAIGGIGAIAFGIIENQSLNKQWWARVGGLLVTLLFGYYELRIQSLIDRNIERAKAIEGHLDYNHIRCRRSWGYFRTHYGTRLFFAILIIFWVCSIWRASGNTFLAM